MSAIDLDVNIRGVVDEGSFEIAGNKALEKIVPTTVNLSKATQGSADSFKDLQKQFLRTQKQATSTSDGLASLGVDVRMLNKSTASANQTLFAFSDLVQDSTQFSQGFAQGMRAIGNNVGFTAELFANLRSRVQLNNQAIIAAGGSAKNLTSVTKELGRSLRGVGGVLIAVNTAFLLLQRRADNGRRETKALRDEAKATAEAFVEVSKSIGDFNSGIADPFALRQRARQIEFLKLQVGALSDEQIKARITQRALTETRKNAAQIGESLVGVIQNRSEVLKTFGNALENTFGDVGRIVGKGVRPALKLLFEFDETIHKIPDNIVPDMFKDLASLIFAVISPTRKFSLLTGQSADDVKRLGDAFEGTQLGKHIDSLTESFKSFASTAATNTLSFLADPIGELQSRFAGLSFEAAKLFGKLTEEEIVEFETIRELRKETERLELTQKALESVLAGALPTYKEFRDTLEELEFTQIALNASKAGISLSAVSTSGDRLTKSTRDLISELRTQGLMIASELGQTEQRIKDKQILIASTDSESEAYNTLNTELQALGVQRDAQIMVLGQLSGTITNLVKPLEQAEQRLAKLSLQFTPFLGAGERFGLETDLMIENLRKFASELKDPELQDGFNDLIDDINSFSELKKLSLGFEGVSELAQASGQLGEVFGASKEFRIAMAMVDGGAAIVSTLADPTLGVVGKLAAAASIAAQVKQQIDQIKKVKIGSAGNVAKPSQASASRASNRFIEREGEDTLTRQGTLSSLFTPQSPMSTGRSTEIVVVNTFNEETVASVARKGSNGIRTSQIAV
tara:strand:- start:490 stop:2892 length:2403 start_codon:yes stop_codon:yes gene_type:complete